jgi:putative membrane protein
MKDFITKTLIIALAVLLASYFLSGVSVNRATTAILVALVLSVLNYFIKPILILLTLPITILTLGLFLFILNAFMIVMASKLVAGFHVRSLGWALLFSLLLSVFTYLLEIIIEPDYKKKN